MRIKSIAKKSISVLTVILLMIWVMNPIQAATGRKLITKTISGSYYTSNSISYSINVTAGISYTNNVIYSISNLSFSNIYITTTIPTNTGNVVPRQISKSYSGTTATYVVQVTRTAQGVYTDKVNYTIYYTIYDYGSPYSLGNGNENTTVNNEASIDVKIEMSEPYDIQYFE